MSKIWLNPDGEIIKNDDGEIIVCEDCPCGGVCSGFPSSVLMTETDAPNASLTLTLVTTCTECRPPLPACALTPTLCSQECFWISAASGGRAFLLRSPALQADRWSTAFCGPSSNDIGFHVTASGTFPYGNYVLSDLVTIRFVIT